MKSTSEKKLQNVYTTLDKLLVSPESYGVKDMPQQLMDILRTMRETLGQALQELQYEEPVEDLAVELSQDADCAS
jgi:hypothetical protein